MTKEDRAAWVRAALDDDQDPAMYAGEGMTSDEEIPRPDDIDNPWVRGRAKHIEEYYPGADKPRRRR